MIANKNEWNRMVEQIIEGFSTDLYHIALDKSFKCTCYPPQTSSHVGADPKCPRCLGTGYKIKIRKITGAYQQTDIPNTTKENVNFSMGVDFYIKEKYKVRRDDIIVTEDSVYVAREVKRLRSFNSKEIYAKINSTSKKYNMDIFYKNFLKIVGDKK